jgi:hypothetical protein
MYEVVFTNHGWVVRRVGATKATATYASMTAARSHCERLNAKAA